MRKILIVILVAWLPLVVDAQITAIVNKDFTVGYISSNDYHECKVGDTVTIHAYTKKYYAYDFVLSSDNFASIYHSQFIPFDIDEKQLKKLPNVKDKNMESFITSKQNEIRKKRKQDALNGKIYYVLPYENLFLDGTTGYGNFSKGDTIYILGYSRSSTGRHEYAIYSHNACGIFTSINLQKDLGTSYLPSVTDTDVKIFLRQKELEETQRYRKDVFAGKVKGIISASFSTKDNLPSPFHYGDTVSVIGYSQQDYHHYFALSSEKGVGVYRTVTELYAFKKPNNINIDLLPSIDSPEVTKVLAKQQEVADSLAEIKIAEKQKKLAEVQQNLIELYKEYSPILITDVTWYSNSVGGIEVQLEVTNCSQQTIKYITFYGYFENAVGDRCRNEIGGSSTWTGKGIGPIGPAPTSLDNWEERFSECKGTYDFDNLTFYSRVAHTFTLSSVTIQYMNGKTITLSGQNLRKHVRYKNHL